MPQKNVPLEKLPYDDNDEVSIINFAGLLTGSTLDECLDIESDIIGGSTTKGSFGQMIESEYFHIRNNSEAVPDFDKVGMELKVTPMVRGEKGELKSKERLVLGIMDYNKVPEMGFRTFSDKNSHLLIIFYEWRRDMPIGRYKILKVVDWRPSESELRIIREDWETINGFIMSGNAHNLSERHTKVLAASTKGMGHGRDMRTQPFSDIPAKQRSLSFKASFMTTLYKTYPDVGGGGRRDVHYGSLIGGEWGEDIPFSEFVLRKFDRFRGRTCRDIERALGVELSDTSYQYHSMLTMAILDVVGKKHVKELEEANIKMKTIRIKRNGTPKESMSFPAFDPDTLTEQTWESSDLLEQIDREFLFPVFGFQTDRPENEARKDLVLLGAFLWYIPDDDLDVVRKVWEDTQAKVREGRRDFVRMSDGRISHVRPHDRRKVYDEFGNDITKRSFWFNSEYIKGVVRDGLEKRYGKRN